MDASEKGDDTAARFLAALADPARPSLDFRTAVVAAHPDDETIGCGAQLSRFSEIRIVHVTDGAPRNGVDAAKLGFAGPAEYATARRRELEAAMAVAGIVPTWLETLGFPDQEPVLHLAEIARNLARRLAGFDVIVTHAYEGGHPDHDAAAFGAHAARALLRKGGRAPAIVEMPLYRAGPDGWAVQTFISAPGIAETVVELNQRERERKQQMFAAHLSQIQVLSRFTLDEERFRAAPPYDFRRLPNDGNLLYEAQNWGMNGPRWLELSRAAADELGMPPMF
jgi:LmbE family N-acetylglucosaminyl deacetylase